MILDFLEKVYADFFCLLVKRICDINVDKEDVFQVGLDGIIRSRQAKAFSLFRT